LRAAALQACTKVETAAETELQLGVVMDSKFFENTLIESSGISRWQLLSVVGVFNLQKAAWSSKCFLYTSKSSIKHTCCVD
jgi:hypothetical protein